MFAETYIAALLFDIDLADEVWEVWNAGEIDDGTAEVAVLWRQTEPAYMKVETVNKSISRVDTSKTAASSSPMPSMWVGVTTDR